jgi:hypothetical protein
MKKLILFVALLLFFGWLMSCLTNKKAASTSSQDTIVDEGDFQTQAEINEEFGNASIEYKDSIERVFQELAAIRPQYKDELNKERTYWDKYQNAVREVAGYGDHGSSTPMFVAGVMDQGVQLREMTLHDFYIHAKGETVFWNENKFTPAMIDDAYSAFINAVGEDEYLKQKSELQAALRKEQKCWNEWMRCRETISKKLSEEDKVVYDVCTNMAFRTKLLQLKNQNQSLGMISGEILKCILPENCSDKALLDYPGFDKVWAKHCENTDWYPFE